MLHRDNIQYNYLMDVVLDYSSLSTTLKDPKKAVTKRVDKARKDFIEELFRLLVM